VRTNEKIAVPELGKSPGYAMPSPDGRTVYVLESNADGDVWMLTLGGAGIEEG
jgi:hypothetical protein